MLTQKYITQAVKLKREEGGRNDKTVKRFSHGDNSVFIRPQDSFRNCC